MGNAGVALEQLKTTAGQRMAAALLRCFGVHSPAAKWREGATPSPHTPCEATCMQPWAALAALKFKQGPSSVARWARQVYRRSCCACPTTVHF